MKQQTKKRQNTEAFLMASSSLTGYSEQWTPIIIVPLGTLIVLFHVLWSLRAVDMMNTNPNGFPD
jgi:hypothetical protein